MPSKRQEYSTEFKINVVLESFQRDTTIEEVCRKFDISSSLLSQWREEFQQNIFSVFTDNQTPELPSEQGLQESNTDSQKSNIFFLIALKNMVIFPRTRSTIAIAREQSVRALEQAMMQTKHLLVAASQHDPDIDYPQPKDIYSTGTLVEIMTMQRQQDASIQVLLAGLHRVQIDEYLDLEPFLRVSVNEPEELQARGPEVDALVRHTINLFEHYAQLNRRFSVEDINLIITIRTPTRLADMLAANVVTDFQQQQELLETLNPLERLEKVCIIMDNEIEILELESTIRSRVRSQVDRTQKEFYLREQLRAIQEELGIETSSEVKAPKGNKNRLRNRQKVSNMTSQLKIFIT